MYYGVVISVQRGALGSFLPRVVFTKGYEFLLVPWGVPGGGVWGRIQVGGAGWAFLWKVRGKGKGVGRVGCGQAREPASQCARVCPNYPLANSPGNVFPIVAKPFLWVEVHPAAQRGRQKGIGKQKPKTSSKATSVMFNISPVSLVPSFWVSGCRNIKNPCFLLPGSIAGKDFWEEISVLGNICPNHPFGNHPVFQRRRKYPNPFSRAKTETKN